MHFDSEVAALNGRLDNERAHIEEEIAALRGRYDTESSSIEKKLIGAGEYTDKAILELDTRMDVAKSNFDVRAAALNSEMARAAEDAKADIFASLDAAKEQNAARIAELKASVAEAKQSLSDEIAESEKRVEDLRERFKETVGRIEAAVSDAVINTDVKAQNAAADRLAQWKAAFDEGEERNKARIADLDALFQQAKENIAGDIAASEEAARQRSAELDTEFAQAKAAIAGDIAETETRLRSIEERVDETAQRIADAVNTAIATTDGRPPCPVENRL